MTDSIFIPFNTPSSKNGRRYVKGRSIGSASTEKYYKLTKQYWIDNKEAFVKMLKGKSKPYKVEFTFIRGSRRKFDYLNPAQTCQDQMVKYGWLADDNMEEMIPAFAPFDYNKEKPGCYIKVM